MGCTTCRILVIEDAPVIREPLSRLLGMEGFDVASAADGSEAMSILESQPIDLILLDVLMPRMDGVKFLSVLRGHERLQGGRHIAVIAITGISDTLKLTQLRELGVRSIMHKVRFSFDALVDEIREQLALT